MMYHLPLFSIFSCKKKRLFFSLIFGFAVAAGIAQPISGTFTINSNQPTAGSNFQSFNEAAYALNAGVNGPVVFNVAPGSGPYEEQVTLYTVPGTSASNTVTFNCNGVTLQFTSTSSINRAGIKLDSADYIRFDSLRITPLARDTVDYEYGYGFQLIRDADHNIIRKCTIINSSNILQPQNIEGIVIVSGDQEANNLGSNQCDSNLIANNTIIGGNTGITIFNFAGYTEPFTTITGNQVLNNTIRNAREAGIYLFGTEGTLVQGNDIGGSINSSTTGINVSERNIQVKVNGNRIHNVYKASTATSPVSFEGIRVAYSKATAGTAVEITNNLIYDIRNDGDQTALSVDNSSFVNFFHNTVVLDTAGAASGATTTGFSYEVADTSIRFQNNILYLTRGGSSSKRAVTVSAAGYNFSCDYNNYYLNATSGSNVIGTFSGTYTTLIAWQSGTGKDYHSYTINPAFQNVAGNVKPTAGALDNVGIYVGIASDIDNITRSNTGPDVGAYEFLSSPCSTPPVPGIANAVPGTILCAGSPVTLTISGNSGGLGQTYQWQTATTATGTYTNVGAATTTTPLDATANTTLYYRLQATCASAVAYSTPIQVIANTTMGAGNYTINKTLPTGGTNYNSFADVLLALKCGIAGPTVFNVAPGTGPYNERVIIPAITGSSATNTVTINGNGETLSNLSTNSAERAVLKLNGASNIIIDSLTITALGSSNSEYGYGVQLINNADNNIIRKSTININTTSAANRYAAIAVSAAADAETTGNANLCDNNTFSGNTLTGGYWGIIVSANTGAAAIINNNRFINNTLRDFYAIGMSIYGTSNTLIEGNDLSRPTRTASTTTYGIYINAVSTALRVSKNRIHNLFDANLTATNTHYGIYTNSSDGTAAASNIYSNNAIYNFNGRGVKYAIHNNGSDYALYYHNTISLDAAATSDTVARGFYQSTSATGIQFKNNIITITRGGAGSNHGIYMNTPATTYTADNNDYYIAATGPNYTGYAATNYAMLANWQTGTSKDANSVSINPLYTNAATGDLKPTANAMDNKGSFVNITTDITGATRSATTPDIGAYEFSDPLPIRLVDISAAKMGADVLVNWSTATEINTDAFIIERSLDGIHFTATGTVAARGNSTILQQYRFNDLSAATGYAVKTLYYRIKATDKDGHFEYTRIVAVHLDGKTTISVSSFPNPFISSLYVKVTTGTNENAAVKLMDMAGKIIGMQEQKVIAGTNLIQLAGASKLAKGTYLVQVTIDGEQFSLKVVK